MIKVLVIIDVDLTVQILHLADDIAAIMRIGGDVFLHDRTLQQMDLPELTTKLDKLPEGVLVFGIRDAWKINLQKLFVFLPVGRAVQDGVDVVKDVDGGESIIGTFLFS